MKDANPGLWVTDLSLQLEEWKEEIEERKKIGHI